MQVDYKTRQPSERQLRALLERADKKGDKAATVTYGEAHSRFTKIGNRWSHQGNGLLHAAYRVC